MHVESTLALLLFLLSFNLISWLLVTSAAIIEGPPKVAESQAEYDGKEEMKSCESDSKPPDSIDITQPALDTDLFIIFIRATRSVIYSTKDDKANDNYGKWNYID